MTHKTQSSPAGEQIGIVLTKDEEQFLIEAEQEEQKRRPCFDARALRQMGLSEHEVNMLQVFFMKARSAEFNVRKFTYLQCLQGLLSALKYLPRTDGTGKITLESYKLSDNIHAADSQTKSANWHEGFRYEYGHGVIWSHKERREPILLYVLAKVFDWIEKFQKAHGLYKELPQWLQDGMAGDFRSDNWIGSNLYEGEKKTADTIAPKAVENNSTLVLAPVSSMPSKGVRQATLFPEPQDDTSAPHCCSEYFPTATDKQKALLKRLMAERGIVSPSVDVDALTRKEASRQIDLLFQYSQPGNLQEAAA